MSSGRHDEINPITEVSKSTFHVWNLYANTDYYLFCCAPDLMYLAQDASVAIHAVQVKTLSLNDSHCSNTKDRLQHKVIHTSEKGSSAEAVF